MLCVCAGKPKSDILSERCERVAFDLSVVVRIY